MHHRTKAPWCDSRPSAFPRLTVDTSAPMIVDSAPIPAPRSNIHMRRSTMASLPTPALSVRPCFRHARRCPQCLQRHRQLRRFRSANWRRVRTCDHRCQRDRPRCGGDTGGDWPVDAAKVGLHPHSGRGGAEPALRCARITGRTDSGDQGLLDGVRGSQHRHPGAGDAGGGAALLSLNLEQSHAPLSGASCAFARSSRIRPFLRHLSFA